MDYKKNLFAQMRIVVIARADREPSDADLVKAMSLNEKLKAYGYVLKPEDVIKLSKSKSLDSFYSEFTSMQDDVKATPMYPNFPKQVMDLSEAEFRMHQLMHYFSTYGLEEIFGCEISKGWLPDMEETEKVQPDATLLDCKVLQVIFEEEMFTLPLKKILEKKERMNLPEKEIVEEAIKHVPAEFFNEITIPFKENLVGVFTSLASVLPPEKARPALAGICQHSGDVWRSLTGYLRANSYRLSTAQKKLMVKVLESFPIEDFEANLYLSEVKGSSIIRKLEFLSFNRFCRKAEYKEAVRKLRNGELKSWNGEVDYLLSHDGEKALSFIAKRPGMLVRLAARLLRLGFSPEDVSEKLCESADKLSMQTLINVLNFFVKESVQASREEGKNVYSVMHKALSAKMASLETPIFGKRIFIEEGDFDFEHSFVDLDQSQQGGYIRSGLAYRIPETIKRVRFFVYWNDERRVDIDLHASGLTIDEREIHVGWNGDFDASGVVHSGDITHSDAAEYVDIDMENTDVKVMSFSVDSYTGQPFGKIDTCFTGMTAVSSIGEEIKLYDPKNCFFSHNLRGNERSLFYGNVDVCGRYLRVVAKPNGGNYMSISSDMDDKIFSLSDYLTLLAETQEAEMVTDRDDADIVLVMGKPADETEISIIESNFFCD